MKTRYITTAMLSALLMTGCVNVRVGCDCKAKHHEGEEKEEHGEDRAHKEHHGEKEDEHHEGKEHHREHEDADDEHEEKGSHQADAKLKAQAKISESTARETALAKVPNGVIKEGELEMEKGKLQWSFDIATPGSKDITEVNIDAINGQIIDVSTESPAEQAKEEKAEPKKEKKDDDKD